MGHLHPNLTDMEYWRLRLDLFELQRQTVKEDSIYDQIKSDLLEDLNNYLLKEPDPWQD